MTDGPQLAWVPPVFDRAGVPVAPDVLFQGDLYYTVLRWQGTKARARKCAWEDIHPAQQEAILAGRGQAPDRHLQKLLPSDSSQ